MEANAMKLPVHNVRADVNAGRRSEALLLLSPQVDGDFCTLLRLSTSSVTSCGLTLHG